MSDGRSLTIRSVAPRQRSSVSYDVRKPARAIASVTPSVAKCTHTPGESDSPTCGRGKALRSARRT